MSVVSFAQPFAVVNGAEMLANLREIARWVKLSGTAEEREAFDFLDQRIPDHGFLTKMLLHDALLQPGRQGARAGQSTVGDREHALVLVRIAHRRSRYDGRRCRIDGRFVGGIVARPAFREPAAMNIFG